MEISENLSAEIIEKDLWVETGDYIEGFEGANNAIGILILKFGTDKELISSINAQLEWLKVIVK